jgi:methionyl-tRNA formyltransferase
MWIALFSNSGTELAEVIERTGTWPDIILLDKYRTPIDKRITDKVQHSSHEDIKEYLKACPKDALVTMHGYLRVLPEECITDDTYNIHPGDIVKYPQLRGIHPQKKAIEEGLDSTGVVIHKVDAGVDTGEIQMLSVHSIKEGSDEASLIKELRDIGINMWVDFLRGKL